MNALLAFCDGQTRGKANLLNSALPRLLVDNILKIYQSVSNVLIKFDTKNHKLIHLPAYRAPPLNIYY